MWECKKCNEFRFDISKECPCKEFELIDQDGDESKIYAISKQDAALKYAERYNTDGDYSLMNTSVDILIDGKKFRISAEPDIHYSADAI